MKFHYRRVHIQRSASGWEAGGWKAWTCTKTTVYTWQCVDVGKNFVIRVVSITIWVCIKLQHKSSLNVGLHYRGRFDQSALLEPCVWRPNFANANYLILARKHLVKQNVSRTLVTYWSRVQSGPCIYLRNMGGILVEQHENVSKAWILPIICTWNIRI
jgi:hypothetical protein